MEMLTPQQKYNNLSEKRQAKIDKKVKRLQSKKNNGDTLTNEEHLKLEKFDFLIRKWDEEVSQINELEKKSYL